MEFGFKITDDSSLMDERYRVNSYIKGLIEEASQIAYDGKGKDVKVLKGLIKDYPGLPQFKNFLSVLLKKIGKEDKAKEVTRLIVKKHPDYLFGKTSFASDLIDEGKLDKVKDVLGEELDLHALYPQRDTFHISEVLAFYGIAIKYYFKTNQLDKLEECSGFIKHIAPDSREAEFVSRLIIAAKVKARKESYGAPIEVVVDKEPLRSDKTEAPEFTHPEIYALYENDMRIDRDILYRILALPRATVIKDLEELLMDSIVRFNHFRSLYRKGDGHLQWFPMHAIFLLAELKSEESMPVIFRVLSQDEEYQDLYFDDFLCDGLWMPLYKIAKDKLSYIKEFLLKPGVFGYSKSLFLTFLEQIVVHHPERKEEISRLFQELVIELGNCSIDDNIVDRSFYGLFACSYKDLVSKDFFPKIKPLFDKKWVSEEFCGSYDYILNDVSDRTISKVEIMNMDQSYDDILNSWHCYKDENEYDNEIPYHEMFDDDELEETTTENKKVGRNEPCPCGSGKKYKKCCLNK